MYDGIKFDTNDWILAPMDSVPIFNTIDAQPPSSRVLPLDNEQLLTGFSLTWEGADDDLGSGIKKYVIYVSDDGAPYLPWVQTDSTEATFVGAGGHTYAFYSIAIDNVGLTEGVPDHPDATTRIRESVDTRVGPNPFVPARGHMGMTFAGPGVAGSRIIIFSSAGDLMQTIDVDPDLTSFTWDVRSRDGKGLASGVYIWTLTQAAGAKEKGKFAIIR